MVLRLNLPQRYKNTLFRQNIIYFILPKVDIFNTVRQIMMFVLSWLRKCICQKTLKIPKSFQIELLIRCSSSPSTRGSASSQSETANDSLSTHSASVPILVTGGYFHASMMIIPLKRCNSAKII